MPTGAGKSLCYQLPAVLAEGKVAVVVCPLIALIKDQLDHMKKLKIDARTINSKISSGERERVLSDLRSCKPYCKLLYITPEQASTGTFQVRTIYILSYFKKFVKLVIFLCLNKYLLLRLQFYIQLSIYMILNSIHVCLKFN